MSPPNELFLFYIFDTDCSPRCCRICLFPNLPFLATPLTRLKYFISTAWTVLFCSLFIPQESQSYINICQNTILKTLNFVRLNNFLFINLTQPVITVVHYLRYPADLYIYSSRVLCCYSQLL